MAALQPGDVLAGFRIEGPLARGGMGIVLRATQLGLDRTVALKVIADELAADDGFRERFVRESRSAASIDHPNVIPIFSAGEEDGVLFLAMRLVDGPDLRTLVRAGGPLEAGRAAHVIAQVGAGLDAAHARGIVHRDVKPANVLLDAGDHAYLTDFGLTKRVGSSASRTTRHGGWVGTLGYVAPEQIRNERVDARTDVYALGCVLFHALTGRPPYEGETDEALLFAHLQQPPPRPGEHGAPAAFDAVIERALAKDPAERFPSAGDLGRAALAAAGGGTAQEPERTVARGAAAPGGPIPGGDATVTAAAPTALVPSTGDSAPARRRPVWTWALATLPLLALAVVAVLLLQAEDPSPRSERTTPPPTRPEPGAPAVATAERAFAVNGRPNDVLFAGGKLWILRGDSSRVAVVERGRLRAGPEVGAGPTAIAAGFDRAWVTLGRPAALVPVRLSTGELDGPPIPLGVPAGTVAVDVAAGEGSVWVGVRGRPGYVVKVDPRRRLVTKVIEVPEGVQNLAVGADNVWVTVRRGNRVVRIDVRTAEEQRIVVEEQPKGIAVGANGVWVANSGDASVTRIDTGTQTTSRVRVGDEPYGVAVGAGAVFVTNALGDSLTRLDPARGGRPVGEVETGRNPMAIDVNGTSIYVASPPDRAVYRLRFRR